jgi:hypothetical protein
MYFLKMVQNRNVYSFKMHIEFLQCNELKVTEKYCWVITQVVRQTCFGQSGYTLLEYGLQVDILVCTYIVGHMYTAFWLAENLNCSVSCIMWVRECACMNLPQYKVGFSSYFIRKMWGLPYFTQVWDFPNLAEKNGGVLYKHKHARGRAHTHTHTQCKTCFCMYFPENWRFWRGIVLY